MFIHSRDKEEIKQRVNVCRLNHCWLTQYLKEMDGIREAADVSATF